MDSFPKFFAGLALVCLSCQRNQPQTTTSQAPAISQYFDSMPIASVIPEPVLKYQQIIEAGHDLNQLTSEGTTYLVQAIQDNLIPAVKALIQSGADANCPTTGGISPLMAVIENGNKSIPKILNNGSMVQVELTKSVNEHLMVQLIQAGADVNFSNQHLQTALMLAATLGNVDATQLLIDNNADLEKQDFNGMTALAFATANNHLDIVKKLLHAGANPNCQDAQGQTPLIYTAEKGNLEIAKCLVNEKADVSLRDAYDVSPLQTAKLNAHEELAKFLIKNGSKD